MSPGCREITLHDARGDTATNTVAFSVMPGIGGEFTDVAEIEFYGTTVGNHDLGVAPDDNYASCVNCVRVNEDVVAGNIGRIYFQASGSLNLTSVNSSVEQLSSGSLSDVTLIEVTIGGGFVSTPVVPGSCLHIQSASWDLQNTCNDGGVEYSGATACADCETAENLGCCAAQEANCLASGDCWEEFEQCLVLNVCTTSACYASCGGMYPNGLAQYECLWGDPDGEGACLTACGGSSP